MNNEKVVKYIIYMHALMCNKSMVEVIVFIYASTYT